MTSNDNAPIVLVGGFLTRNTTSYWGDIQQFFQQQDNQRDIIIAPVGACSSLHDRACEIFYSLKGGRVDYGAQHAVEHKHGRYGRFYPTGSHPQWSTQHPVHFVTHSLGGPTVIKLISLLRSGFFGDEFHPDMVRSVFSVAAPFKGTPTVYLLGASYQGHKNLRLFSIGNMIAKYIHISSFFGPLLSPDYEAFDFQPDARNLGIFSLPHRPAPFPTVESLAASLNADGKESVNEEEGGGGVTRRTWRGLRKSLGSLFSNLRTSEWADSVDSGAYDSTCHAAQAREDAGDHGLNPGTFYCSFTGTISVKEEGSAHHRPDRSFKSDILMYIMAKMVGSFSYNLSPLPSFLLAKPTPPSLVTSGSTLKVSRRRRRLEICAAAPSEPITPVEEEEATSPSSALGVDWLGQQQFPVRPSISTHSPSASSSSNMSASSGSSGWHSRTPSSLSTPEECETECTWPSMRHSHSRQPSAVSMTSMDEQEEEEKVERGHHRRWSSTDWYASIAANWSFLPKTTTTTPVVGSTTTTPAIAEEETGAFDFDEVVGSSSQKRRRGVAPGLLAMKKAAKKQGPVVEEKVAEKQGEQKLRDDLWENDGVVPVFSQHHPSECSIHHCQHHGFLSLDANSKSEDSDCNALHIGSFDKGVWHVFTSRGLSHNTFVGGLARYESRRAALWTKISEAVKDLDLTARAQRSPSVDHVHLDATSPAKFIVTPPSP
ncbi:alpha/beta-hydrolase [Serendipita vermifera]|nr:alpha/beta-hydrolase [Serendipita vermifera]